MGLQERRGTFHVDMDVGFKVKMGGEQDCRIEEKSGLRYGV